jgi:hypothetical protein
MKNPISVRIADRWMHKLPTDLGRREVQELHKHLEFSEQGFICPRASTVTATDSINPGEYLGRDLKLALNRNLDSGVPCEQL